MKDYHKQCRTFYNVLVFKKMHLQGVFKKKIPSKGYGESKPIDTNDTVQGRQKNKRT